MSLEKKPRSMYGITRIDQPEKKNHGYYVRITHKGVTSQKYFPDKSSGGKAKALKLTKCYRDELLAEMPVAKQELAAKKRRNVPQSGVQGVTHVVSKLPSGQYAYWQAAWADKMGVRHTAKFSIMRYGHSVALATAIKTKEAEDRKHRSTKSTAKA